MTFGRQTRRGPHADHGRSVDGGGVCRNVLYACAVHYARVHETGWEVPGFFQMLSPAWQLIMDPETEMLGPAVRDLCFGILFNFVGLYFFSDRRKKADTRPAE